MRCPYCSNPAFENLQECPRCGFALHKLDAVFGSLPRLTPGIADEAALFTARDTRKLLRHLKAFHEKFPQLFLHIATVRLTYGANLAAYAFWIFNRAGICNELEKGGDNRDILLLIDAMNARAVLIVGYGLEPFVGEAHLTDAVSAGAADFVEGYYFDGTVRVIDRLGATLTRISGALDETYGIRMQEILRAEEAGRQGAAAAGGDAPY